MPVAYSIRWKKPLKSRGDLRVNESNHRDQDESQKWREVAEVERASEVTGFFEGKGDKRVVGGTQVRAQDEAPSWPVQTEPLEKRTLPSHLVFPRRLRPRRAVFRVPRRMNVSRGLATKSTESKLAATH